ncbi:MAG: hypothetical protein OXC99_04960 [Chloroflexi bacterium]|nr:hypothetical protein [Chloroflexota bacterium]
MATALKKELEFYLAHQSEMVQKYNGRVIVIKDCAVLGEYDSYLTADLETQKYHQEGTYLLQRVSEGEKDYTTVLHTPGVVRV